MAIEGRSIQLPIPYPDPKTGVWDAFALLRNLQFLASKITAIQTGQLMPSGTMIMMRTGGTCPDGYDKVTDAGLANRYLRVNVSSAGGTGGSSTSSISSSGEHTHSPGVPTSTTLVTSAATGTTFTVASNTHVHVISSSGAHTHSVSVAPLFIDIILCEKT